MKNNCICKIIDKNNELQLFSKGNYLIDTKLKYTSFFSYSEYSIITISNAKYTVENKKIDYYFPLGVSNEKIYGNINLKVSDGIVLLINSSD